MLDRVIDVDLTEPFRIEARRWGFAGRPELLAATVRVQTLGGLPTPDVDGLYWFERRIIERGRGRQQPSKSIWLGGQLVGGVLVLSDIRIQEVRIQEVGG